MMRPLLSTLVLSSALATGCAGTASHVVAQGPARSLGSATQEPLVLEGGSLTGPSSTLSLDEHGMHGRFRSSPVALAWDYQRMTGTVGELATRLELAEGDDTRVWGAFAGMPVDLTEDGTWLHGRMGGCSYALKRTSDATLEGMRECGGVLERDIDVAFPSDIARRPLGERAALMALALVNTQGPVVLPRVAVTSGAAQERTGAHRRKSY
ncbi:hypothetical protein LZ198_38265 [Myxococcus sp. K15C18031901]|uniref:hypothetical protein n=1 Tax=Myxococcus dinghuensis TaxID=2906761 RepID=UPI0020A79E75|nr:hypothetical protein [Myxococcus dinghuensis]MCP3104727.1 hypothetical protein [Myxococcus dinghuensis]